ncbi:MAG TPA: HAD-IA family hydrolase [Myxococcota bacterium]|nr:HAD-IA family hydrolase [Myxococcota bacterium]
MEIPLDPSARALLFDLDGTLVDSMPAHLEAWRVVLAPRGLRFPDGFMEEVAGRPTLAIAGLLRERFGFPVEPAALAAEKQAAFLARVERVRPVPETVALARAAHGKLPLAVGTGGRREQSARLLERAGLRALFSAVVTSEDVARPKPAPDTWLRCAELLGVPPEGCLVLEDAESGFEAARRAGMRVLDVRPYILSPASPPGGGD